MLAENLTPFFSEFAVDGVLAGSAVRVIFDSPTDGVFSGAGMAVHMPQVTLPTASVPAAVHGALLVIPQGSFTVRDRSDDGTGITTLMLQGAS